MNLHSIPNEVMHVNDVFTDITNSFQRLLITPINSDEDEFYQGFEFTLNVEQLFRTNAVRIVLHEIYDYQDVLVVEGKTLTDALNNMKTEVDKILERGYWRR